MRRSVDVFALLVGLLLTALAAGSLWSTFVGALNWHLIKIAAPLGLVAIGILGLALSRNRS
jgi:hypothetical protein